MQSQTADNQQTNLTREQKLNLIYRHTHRDYKGSGRGALRSILVLRNGTCLVPLSELTEAEISYKLPFALKDEARRQEKKVLQQAA